MGARGPLEKRPLWAKACETGRYPPSFCFFATVCSSKSWTGHVVQPADWDHYRIAACLLDGGCPRRLQSEILTSRAGVKGRGLRRVDRKEPKDRKLKKPRYL